MAATEHGHMASVPDMYFAFKKRGLKFISGCELYFNNYEPLRQEMELSGEKVKAQDEALRQRIVKNRHLTILAKNATGFSNLLKLTTLAWKWGFYYKPRTWFEKLCEYKEGLIVLSGCMNGPLSHEIRLDIEQLLTDKKLYPRVEGRDFTAAQYLKKFKEAFGEDFFVEVQMPCLPELHDVRVFWKLIELADKYNVRSVLSNDSHYLKREDAYLQKIMMAIDQGTTVYDPNLFYINSEEQYFKTRAELWATFKNNGYASHVDDAKFEEICDNTLLVAERCEKLDPDTSPKIPSWSAVEPGANPESKLRNVVHAELKRLGWDKDKTKWFSDGRMVTYAEQAEIELNRFIDKGFASYFLITWDMILWGKSQNFIFGPRGSVGGSLVCYLLGIHCLNSLRFGLSFDRFMASSRGGYLLKVNMSD
jgi:DNA polymerase-3 subunit alpha